MKIKITSDSTCDLTAQLLEQHNITLTPLTVIMDGKEYKDGLTITPAEIFAHVAAGGALCSTSAVSIGEYMEVFTPLAREYDAVIHINIGSGFSTSYQSACLAAEEFDNVYVIDSRNLSTGQGLVVMEAVRMAEAGHTPQEICSHLNDYTGKVEASFVVDKLDYLVKGGRCSSAAALGANLLGLKPCIEVREGKMTVVKKYRGNFTKCLSAYVADRLADREDIDPVTLFVTRTEVSDECRATVLNAVAEHSHFENVWETTAGCTVSCHCGPGTLGILFVRK